MLDQIVTFALLYIQKVHASTTQTMITKWQHSGIAPTSSSSLIPMRG